MVAEVAGPDEQGITGGVSIRESLSNANAATANMADETEAREHNFLFRHRGYHNIANIDPGKYRKDALFARSSNYRVWLPANELFRPEPNGLEQLTTQGKDLLNRSVAQYGDSVVESPIVIEGYSAGANAADQLVSSRSRAILVRRYLQMHFQLDPGNLGAVPMMNVPPSGLGHPTWDGICIIILKDRS